MKSFNVVFIIILSYSSLFGQGTVLWSELNKNKNPISINTNIKFSNNGKLQSSSGNKLFDLQANDIIQIFKTKDKTIIFFEDSTVILNLIAGKFELKFDGDLKPFEFIENTDGVDIESNNSSKSNITLSTPYYNAFLIYNYLIKGDSCKVYQIFKSLQLEDKSDNQFLNDIIKECDFSRESSSYNDKINKNNILSSMGGLDVTKYADGLAKFLVKRAKEELTISFFEKFKRELDAQSDIKLLFPKTHKVLSRIEDVYDYSRYLNLLRESYQIDFNSLPENVDKLISGKVGVETKYKLGVHLSAKIIQGLRDKSHPGRILASMDVSGFDPLDVDVKNSFIISQTLSESLRETDLGSNTTYWIDGSKILELSQNRELLKIFIGLTIEKFRAKNPDIFAILNDASKVDLYAPIISEIAQVTQGISSLVNANHGEGNINNEDISKYIDYSLKLFQVSKKVINIINSPNGPTHDLNNVLMILSVTNSMYSNIATKKYSLAIFDLLELIDSVPGIKNDTLESWLKKYGSFMAETIAAENSDEVAKVIETYAMPSGSSRVKRNSNFNISLNSYLGIYGGVEDGKSVFGITAPVGVAFSHGGKGGSISLFLTAIDIGAISSFRFNNDDDEVAKIYLKEIISPGVFISYGIKQSPFSFNFGWQRAPLLKRVGPSNNEVDIVHNSRVSLSVLVDIPLFNIYNRTKK